MAHPSNQIIGGMSLQNNHRLSSQREKILNLLRSNNEKGVTNNDLAKVALNYKARVGELYEQGYVVNVENLKEGVYLYTLVREPNVIQEKPPKAFNLLQEAIETKYGGSITGNELEEILQVMNFYVIRRPGSYKAANQ